MDPILQLVERSFGIIDPTLGSMDMSGHDQWSGPLWPSGSRGPSDFHGAFVNIRARLTVNGPCLSWARLTSYVTIRGPQWRTQDIPKGGGGSKNNI